MSSLITMRSTTDGAHNSIRDKEAHQHYLEADLSNVGLPTHECIQSSGSGRYLQVLSQDPIVMFCVFQAKDSRKPLATLSTLNPSVVERIKAAWEMGVEESLIAYACVEGSMLLVTDCNLKNWEIPFAALHALSELSVSDRPEFDLDEDGSFLYWESVDVHLDMEALRAVVDPVLKEKLKAEALVHDENFGRAIERVRKNSHLNQDEVDGVSERQIRRIEKGSRPKLETLRRLAKAHKLSLDEYLDQVSKAIKGLS